MQVVCVEQLFTTTYVPVVNCFSASSSPICILEPKCDGELVMSSSREQEFGRLIPRLHWLIILSNIFSLRELELVQGGLEGSLRMRSQEQRGGNEFWGRSFLR